jgi:serine/threonine protein kinase
VAGTIFAGRYRLLDVLGNGSNGPVWRALDANHGEREVALKRFAPGQPNIVAYEEAGILTRLESDHILKVYNADTFEDVPYIATAVAASTAESELLARAPLGLRPDLVLTWTRQLLVGLGICHDAGLVHRDVKPPNLFLDQRGRALLGDFGLARADRGSGAPVGGTPRIRAPELFANGYATSFSDIWAVGVTMYRLLTGEWPFETSQQVLRGEFVRLREMAPHLPRRLADRVEHALRLDPGDRYGSAGVMAAELSVPDLLPRVWSPESPHPGHARCWAEQSDGWTGLDVCLIGSASTSAIEVRRASSTRPRVNAFCLADVKPAGVTRALQATFRAISTS